MEKKNILILWDIDGTLMHCGADGTTALNKTFKQLYGIENAFSRVGIGSAMDAVILDKIMDSFHLDKGDMDQVIQTYIEILTDILNKNENKRVLPGIWELLNYIDESENYYSALLTSNLKAGAKTKLESVNLHKYFLAGGYGDEFGEKWHAAELAIAEAEEVFGVTFYKDHIFLIGDGAYDVEAARKVGIKSMGVATGWMDYEILKEHKPDYIFHNLSDFNNIIELWKTCE